LSDNRKEKETFLDIVDHPSEEKERSGREKEKGRRKSGNCLQAFGKKYQVEARVTHDIFAHNIAIIK
jgi:hypothetical protein